MEVIEGTHKASKFAPQDLDLDFISSMPDIVVTNILDRLPIRDAVRTSILSRNWRFKWTLLSQLVFDLKFHYHLRETKHYKDYERIISRLLLNLKGAITKFLLFIEESCNDEDIAHWILFLSRKRVKDLTIWKINGPPLKLPTHLFSCLELKHLELNTCFSNPPATFHGFPNLLSLELADVEFKRWKLGEFFTQCPVLESLNLGYTVYEGQVKPIEIAKLTNLKILTLSLCNLEYTAITSSSSIFELVGLIPKLQELHLDFEQCECFTEDGATKKFSTTFPSLKTLKLSNIDLSYGIMLSFAFGMIRSSPNLQTLEIKAQQLFLLNGVAPSATCSLEVENNTMELLQLQSFVFTYLKGSENEVCLIKYLLACSPFLKKIFICCNLIRRSEEKLMLAMDLLKLHRASPVAEINLY